MGGILALLAQPVWQWLTGHHVTPRVAAAVVVLGVVLGIIAPLAFLVTKAIQQGIAIGHGLAEGGVSVRSLLDHVSGWAPIETLVGSPAAVETQVRRWIQSAGTGATATVVGLAAYLPTIAVQVALASIACFFLLVDGPRLLGWMTDKIPIAADVRGHVVQAFQETAISVIWATIAAAAAQSVVMVLSFLTLGVPAAFLAAGATFILAWIPLVGCSPVWLAGAISSLCPGCAAQSHPDGGLWPDGWARRQFRAPPDLTGTQQDAPAGQPGGHLRRHEDVRHHGHLSWSDSRCGLDYAVAALA